MTLDEHSVQGSLLMTPVDDLDVVIDDLRRQVADLHVDRDQLMAGVARLQARIAELERGAMTDQVEGLLTAISRALDEWERVTLPAMDGDADELAAAMDGLARVYAEAMNPS